MKAKPKKNLNLSLETVNALNKSVDLSRVNGGDGGSEPIATDSPHSCFDIDPIK